MGSNQHGNEITASQRKRAVAQAFAGRKMPSEIADGLGVSASAIYIWCADERFGGKVGGLSGRNESAQKTYPLSKSNGALPQRAKASSPRKPGARALVPTHFACPHCGGPIKGE
jgi:transposase-like protein